MNPDKFEAYDMLVKNLEKGLDDMEQAAESYSQQTNDAPGAMQSRYDSSREELGAVTDALFNRNDEKSRDVEMARAFNLSPSTRVGIGSLVNVQKINPPETNHYFVLPFAGGESIDHEDGDITVVTPNAPLVGAMADKRKGDFFIFSLRGSSLVYKILDIS
jgi:transcription elongation GreA/GreB family factor